MVKVAVHVRVQLAVHYSTRTRYSTCTTLYNYLEYNVVVYEG